ncbi:hypothetical protein [uncultured Chitinophaga sp.]|jgi:hypothetical protein|uniref:hypothetical protein n=1 Tax=uncultured Chitinophaga sp. TaxID=339340 RepID=UPI0026112BF4|nr:hypothetical protein [uncultured Chitinophaga sp.]
MKALHHNKQSPEYLELTGRLELRTFYANTKRSFSGIYLVTEKAAYLIRPAHMPADGHNPLQALLGKVITATGQLKHEVFLAQQFSILNE